MKCNEACTASLAYYTALQLPINLGFLQTLKAVMMEQHSIY